MSDVSDQGRSGRSTDSSGAGGPLKPTVPPPGRPRIGDSRPAPDAVADSSHTSPGGTAALSENVGGGSTEASGNRRRRPRAEGAKRGGAPERSGAARRGGGRSGASNAGSSSTASNADTDGTSRATRPGAGSTAEGSDGSDANRARRKRRRRSRSAHDANRAGTSRPAGSDTPQVVEHYVADRPVKLDEAELKSRRGRVRKGRPVGRYVMVVSKKADATHIAILEGRNLIEYYVSRSSDDVYQIHGNMYLGKVQNVLPGMEAAFVDIATPKNAVIYRSDVMYDATQFEGSAAEPRIEELLKPKQTLICQVTKNPIAHKGARLTAEVSLPGRFVVLVPNSSTYGISKRLPDNERKRLRRILDKVRPAEHGIIVRTAAENVTASEIERDVQGLLEQWKQIEALAATTKAPALLYREPEMSVRVIREEFNAEYRAVIIDDPALFEEVSSYVSVISPALADRVEYYDTANEPLPAFERYHVHEQLHKALDRKVWLPSGGSLIIEHTEALTVIDVNTGKNVGSSNLEETVFRNNLEAAEEVAHQLRLRDIGGIIVIDFVDMEDKKNREEVIRTFRQALARDKTRTQVYEIGELGLAEMTRKRIGEGLLESLSSTCPHCDGTGHILHTDSLSDAGAMERSQR